MPISVAGRPAFGGGTPLHLPLGNGTSLTGLTTPGVGTAGGLTYIGGGAGEMLVPTNPDTGTTGPVGATLIGLCPGATNTGSLGGYRPGGEGEGDMGDGFSSCGAGGATIISCLFFLLFIQTNSPTNTATATTPPTTPPIIGARFVPFEVFPGRGVEVALGPGAAVVVGTTTRPWNATFQPAALASWQSPTVAKPPVVVGGTNRHPVAKSIPALSSLLEVPLERRVQYARVSCLFLVTAQGIEITRAP